jgi:hypothetical protein
MLSSFVILFRFRCVALLCYIKSIHFFSYPQIRKVFAKYAKALRTLYSLSVFAVNLLYNSSYLIRIFNQLLQILIVLFFQTTLKFSQLRNMFIQNI